MPAAGWSCPGSSTAPRDLLDPDQVSDPLAILDTRAELVMVAGEVPIRRF